MEGLGNLQTFVSLLASNSYSSGTDSESRQQPDELDVLQDLRATATHITEYFSLPSKVLPAKAVVDLAAMSSSGKYEITKFLESALLEFQDVG